jgi:hypothetical protein
MRASVAASIVEPRVTVTMMAVTVTVTVTGYPPRKDGNMATMMDP